jgi:hypothetical protein
MPAPTAAGGFALVTLGDVVDLAGHASSMMSRIRSREQKPATTGSAPSSFSTDTTPNCASRLTHRKAAAPQTRSQPAAPHNP